MRTVVEISFKAKCPGGVRGVLELVRCGRDVGGPEKPWSERCGTVRLDETDSRLPVLLEVLRERGLHWVQSRADHYTEEELDGARLLLMAPNTDPLENWPVRSMRYNWSGACQMCGSGARQTSAMTLLGEEVEVMTGQRAGVTDGEHVLVDQGLAADLERTGATGLSVRDVYARVSDTRRVKVRWKQLCAARTLPPMSPRTAGITRHKACEVCRRFWYFEQREPRRIVYRAADLRDADDVNLSWEHRGFGFFGKTLNDSTVWSPWFLVSPKVRRVFRDAGVVAFDWLPIWVEDG